MQGFAVILVCLLLMVMGFFVLFVFMVSNSPGQPLYNLWMTLSFWSSLPPLPNNCLSPYLSYVVLGIEPRGLYLPASIIPTELHPSTSLQIQSFFQMFLIYSWLNKWKWSPWNQMADHRILCFSKEILPALCKREGRCTILNTFAFLFSFWECACALVPTEKTLAFDSSRKTRQLCRENGVRDRCTPPKRQRSVSSK